MRIHRTLEQSLDQMVRIGDILEITEKAAETNHNLAMTVLDKVGHGESETSALGAAAYFMEQERIYRYDIPNILSNILNEPLQTDKDKDQD